MLATQLLIQYTKAGAARTLPADINPDMTMDQTTDGDQARYTITEAAQRLGISREALRLRIRRGRVLASKSGGLWYVYLPADTPVSEADNPLDMTGDTSTNSDQGALVVQLQGDLADARGEVARLWEELQSRRLENERKDAVILALSQRPALPAPRAEPPAETPTAPRAEAAQSPAWRPWWRRWLGG